MNIGKMRPVIFWIICLMLLGSCLLHPFGIWAVNANAPLTPVNMIVQWVPQSQFAGYYVALEKGFYRREGLDVHMIRGGPDQDPGQYLASGQAEFATAFLTGALSYRENGIPVVNLAQVVNRSNQVVIAWKDKKIDAVKDLNGRRISVWEGGFRPGFLAFFQANQVNPVIIPQYYSVSLFLLRGVDACVSMYYNEYHMLYQSGINAEELSTFLLRDYGFGFPEDGIYCLEKTYQNNPKLCQAFVKASLDGWSYAGAHPEEALDIVMKYVREANVPTNREHMKWMLNSILPTIIPGPEDKWQMGKLDPADYQKTVQLMQEQGQIKSAPSYEVFRGEGIADAP
ncbi:MAG: ABC transporter substrate-binding protein [Syntrophomonas sp.]